MMPNVQQKRVSPAQFFHFDLQLRNLISEKAQKYRTECLDIDEVMLSGIEQYVPLEEPTQYLDKIYPQSASRFTKKPWLTIAE